MRTRSRKSKTQTRLIVAASETDPDMLYATKFWAPDPFIFLERNGKRTLVLSDLEMDRGRRLAEATKARFTLRTRGDGAFRRFTLFVGFFEDLAAGAALCVFGAGVFRAG